MNFQRICRICTEESSEMVSIFESYNFSKENCEIFKVITDFASVQIEKFDGFSEQICRRCLDLLSQTYSFKKLCEDSDYKFRNGLIISDEIDIKVEFSEEDNNILYDEVMDNTITENLAENSNGTDFALTTDNRVITNMRDEELKNHLQLQEEDVLQVLHYNNPEDFKICIRTNLDKHNEGSNYSSQCDNWVSRFSEATKTRWIVRQTYPNLQKLLYRKMFVCHHTNFNKIPDDRRVRSNVRVKGKGCGALIDIRIKKINPFTLRNDPHLKTGLSGVIIVTFKHNHDIHVPEAYSWLNMAGNTKQIFINYFKEGMTPTTAKAMYEMKIRGGEENIDAATQVGDSQYKPRGREVIYLFDKWRSHTEEQPEMCNVSDNNLGGDVVVKNEIVIKSEFSEEDTIINDADNCEDINQDSYKMNEVTLLQVNKGSASSQYKCEICNKSLSTKKSLKRHTKIHEVPCQRRCKVCGKIFLRNITLENHMRTHTAMETHAGEIKTEDLGENCNLKKHSALETRKKSFQCEVCKKTFTRNTTLTKHKKLHTGESKYK